MSVEKRLAELEEASAIAIADLVLERRKTLPKCESPEFRKAELRRLFASQSKMIAVRRQLETSRAEQKTQLGVEVIEKSLEVCATVLAEICETVCIIRSRFPTKVL